MYLPQFGFDVRGYFFARAAPRGGEVDHDDRFILFKERDEVIRARHDKLRDFILNIKPNAIYEH
jgi:hypothetical protein